MSNKFEAPEIPEFHALFAKDVAEAAKKHGIDRFTLEYRPNYSLRHNHSIHGNLKIHFSSADGRGRPANNLSIQLETSLIMTISETPESSS